MDETNVHRERTIYWFRACDPMWFDYLLVPDRIKRMAERAEAYGFVQFVFYPKQTLFKLWAEALVFSKRRFSRVPITEQFLDLLDAGCSLTDASAIVWGLPAAAAKESP
ncbi:MAG: hypothetical protein E6R03_10730 [Hyphomicrobiaceae bacterium]|nr:MAG: hypothetical protein E6R03_10730 [Hyphomicrobiaceae bacterium]